MSRLTGLFTGIIFVLIGLAGIVLYHAAEGLDLILNPKRLKATLRY